ncbi:DMT family transporter [Anabaena sp. 4-3]|uniref:DMT family transporter n=1 Tax=Anabaena sp. 4-3 TaxID=1811979 RepID=UPI00082ACD11|nr:DMT family transporter [Anabaena sp. 4-3]
MGRFEKRPDNPRVRGEISRAAETALWAVVEDLESLQQNLLRSLQEEIKRLQSEKDRLTDEIHQLIEEKEHLQEVRRITEQQVLIRQLSEALAKHICSQLQSSLAAITSQTEHQIAALKSTQSINPAHENSQEAEKILGTLDDNLTIAFNSLQQELKNYQNNLSQQLSRMYSQQQEGEKILDDFIDQMREGLTKTIQETSRIAAKVSPPTVLQPGELPPSNSAPVVSVSPPTVLQPAELRPSTPQQTPSSVEEDEHTRTESVPTLREKSTQSHTISQSAPTSPSPIIVSPSADQPSESVTSKTTISSNSETNTPPVTETPPEPISVLHNPLSQAPETKQVPEPISVLNQETSSSPAQSSSTPTTAKEPISVLNQETSSSPAQSSSTPTTAKEPISVLNRNLSASQTSPAPASQPRRGSTPPPASQSPRKSGLSPIQIGFLLIVSSTVMSSLYNVAIKGMFYKTSQMSTGLVLEGLISPTVGNIMLILTLRLMVVVPLMMLLAPMMHPQVWQDLQNIKESFGKNRSNTRVKKQSDLQLIIASGCFLFLSQVLIYLAIGQVATGTAIALFFIYPLINVILSWLLLRDRPSKFRTIALGAIFCGQLLVFAGLTTTGIGNNIFGGFTAIGAGVAFACYLLLTRVCAAKIHPVSLTFINFATMLALSFVFLMLPLPNTWNLAVDPSKILEIVLTAAILGVLTLLGYVSNHIGVNKLGASRSAIIGAGVPILTVIFAGLMLQESLSIVQIFGVLCVTFGAAAFNFVTKRNQTQSPG